jgi:hypothetical protein
MTPDNIEFNAVAPLVLLAINFGVMWQKAGGINQPGNPENLILGGAGIASSLLSLVGLVPVFLNELEKVLGT